MEPICTTSTDVHFNKVTEIILIKKYVTKVQTSITCVKISIKKFLFFKDNMRFEVHLKCGLYSTYRK